MKTEKLSVHGIHLIILLIFMQEIVVGIQFMCLLGMELILMPNGPV